MAGIIDLQSMGNETKRVLLLILRWPFERWYYTPWWIKSSIITGIFILSIFILITVWKNKDKWKYRRY